MTPLDALQRTVNMAKSSYDGKSIGDEAEFQKEQQAIEKVELLLNTAVPIARFRMFVQVRSVGGAPPKKHKPVMMEPCEFTVCSPTIAGLKMALEGLRRRPCDVFVSLFEQKEQSADYLTGYDGPSRGGGLYLWSSKLEELYG